MQTARAKATDAIYNYYNGEIDNFKFEDALPVADDSLIIEFKNQIWFFYDDTRSHLWFEYYSREVEFFISVWLYFLNTDKSWNELKNYVDTSQNGKVCWENSAKKIMSTCGVFPLYIPHVSLSLIKKTLDINKFYYLFFRHFYLNRLKQKILSIIMNRIPQECVLKWGTTGRTPQDIFHILPLHIVNKTVLSRILPSDSWEFVLLEPYLTKVVSDFMRQKNQSVSIIQLINTNASLVHNDPTALINYR